MLLQRVVTGLALAIAAVLLIHYLSGLAFALVFALVAAAGAYEWAGLCRFSPLGRGVYVAVFLLFVCSAYVFPQLQQPILLAGILLWLFAILAVLIYPRGEQQFRQAWFTGLLGWWVLTTAWVGLVTLRAQPDGQWWLIWVLLIAALADIGAYFAGRRFGRRKLAPAVSPGKTWEGVLGGLLFTVFVSGTIVGLWQGDPLSWLVIIVVLAALSVFGDLFESVLKRATGVKDSGSLLPGHGGVLDRIDSMVVVVPLFALWLTHIGL